MKRLARFNWYILLACFLAFAAGGTLAGVAAIILSGNLFLFAFSIVMSLGLFLAAGCALHQMERC